MGQAPAEVQALLREHTTTHQVNELHYLKKLPADPSAESVPMIVFLNGAGERGPADGSELDRACMHGVLKVALAGPRAGLAGGLCAAWLSAVADGQGQGMSAPPYDAVMPNSVSFPVDPEAVLNESDPLQHTPFASATYTYHAGTFDVHTNDTVRDGSTMISNGVFAFADLNQSTIIEADFWEIVDGWEALGTERFATPVLGVGHSRVFHTISANG